VTAIRFTFNGREIKAREGQSVAAALLAADVTMLTRSSKYRRPRGIHCAAGHCPNCMLRIDGIPHVRACMRAVEAGMTVETEGATAARIDPFRTIDRLGWLFPVGFQYRYFKRQNSAWRAWERQLRRVAAESAIPEAVDVEPAERLVADLLIVGGGPAGIGAASAAAAQGANVVLVTRRATLGGRLRPVLARGGEPLAVREAIAAIHASERIRVIAPGTAVASFPGVVLIDDGTRVVEVRAERSILATGAYERSVPFPGNDRPGVMLASALRRLVLEEDVLAGATAVLVATDDAAYATACELRDAGTRVAAVLDLRASGPAGSMDELDAAGVRIVRGARIVGISGRSRVTAIEFEAAEDSGSIRCDVVGMSGGWQAADDLRYVATSTGDALVVGERANPIDPTAAGVGPLPLLQAAGAVAGTADALTAFAEGALAGTWAADAPASAITVAVADLAAARGEQNG
jgi:sarcosine oxidase subunit alpha